MTESLAIMAGKVLAKEESDYIENILKACDEDLSIKTYTVVRENTFEELKSVIDGLIEMHPMFELASTPLNLRFLDIDKWVAILVEYEPNVIKGN